MAFTIKSLIVGTRAFLHLDASGGSNVAGPFVPQVSIVDANGAPVGGAPAAPVVGQIAVAVTSTAVNLPSATMVNGVVLKAKATNSSTIFVGGVGVNTIYDGTGAGYPLEPGDQLPIVVSNLNVLWVNGTAGSVLSWGGN